MKLGAIKQLTENYSLAQLEKAEQELINDLPLSIDVAGDDEGEKLTHILGATDILNMVKNDGIDLKAATRLFFERVRKSIS